MSRSDREVRTSKTVDGVTTTYYLDGTNIIEQSDGTNTLHFYYDSNDDVIGFTYNEADYFYVKNAMSDIVGIVDDSGNLIVSYAYDAWGKVLSVTGSNTEIGIINPFRYRSYYYDGDIEMYYLQSRYYDPEVCRFINSDDVNFIGATGTVNSYNAFAYCENNAVNGSDPSGQKEYKIDKKDFKSDWYGIKILTHYLTGNGKTLIIKNNKKWTTYLTNAKMCGCPGHEKYNSKLTLRQHIGNLIKNKKVKLPKKVFDKKTTTVKAAITNGEGIIGINYLHGTNAKKGGLKLSIGLVLRNNKKYYEVTVTWNDYIDPNFTYDSDSKKYAIAKKLPLVNPTDYTIRITWTDYYIK